MSYAELELPIGVGRRHRGQVRNEVWTWARLVEKLSAAEVGRETLAEYRAMDKEQQLALKNVGFFVAGHCRDGIRRKENVESRSLICLDFDDVPEAFYNALREGESGLSGVELFWHTTRKHSVPDSIRLRVIVPLAETIEPVAYEPVARMVASWIDPRMDWVDRVSFRASQYMFWPSRCSDGDFASGHQEGELLNPDTVLLEYLDWQDPEEWPKREGERLHGNVNEDTRREDPRERISAPHVAAFCRTFSVQEAIDCFLPGIYAEADGYGDERYTFLAGSSAGGARVYDDGLYLHSEHDTDPAHGQHNAFDLVRIHRFGEQDAGLDVTLVPLSNWPSFKAMQQLVEEDPRCRDALLEVKEEAFAARCEGLLDLFDDVVEPEDDAFDDLGGFGTPGPKASAKPSTPEELLQFLTDRMLLAEDLGTLDKVARKVQDLAMVDFGQRHRDRLADVYVRRTRELSEGKYSLTRAEAKKHLRPTEKASREALVRSGMPDWLENWVYLTGDDKFLHLETTEKVTPAGFNAKYDARCAAQYPSEETGLPAIRPAEAATALFAVPTPYQVQYWPGRGALYEHQGLEFANTYRDTGCRPDGYAGDRGVQLLRIHVANILPDEREQALLLDFLAHPIQNPERKLMYACLLKGVQGDGKSFFYELLEACLGEANCKVVQSSMLRGQFNGWAAETLLCFIEEVKQHGPDAFEVLNNLKPLVTNRTVPIERKGKDVISLKNFANFFMTTNFSDALPIAAGESRYMALATRFRTESERQEWEAEWEAEHGYPFFETLYAELRERPWQFRRFLEEYEFSQWYNPSARAPETQFKATMIEDAKTDERQVLEDVLDRGNEPLLTEDVFCWWRFKQILDLEMPRNRMNGRAVSALMNAMGFVRAGKERFNDVPGMDGKQGWVWTRNPAMCGDGSTMSEIGKTTLSRALTAWQAQEDFDLSNVVPLRR